jgi:hypothetical protein
LKNSDGKTGVEALVEEADVEQGIAGVLADDVLVGIKPATV